MCGIVGIIDDQSDKRGLLLRAMTNSVMHRGPDEEGVYEDAHAALGVRRLAIQDVEHGHQPVADESADVICVLNGEFYNVGELQATLRARGHKLASESDTDCIPHLYEEYGLAFVEHLRGMFTIAIWHKSEQRLILVRDRLGKKPLYFSSTPRRFTFGSELKALLIDPALAREADPIAISHFLTYQYVPAPWSAVSGAKKLPPGHMLIRSRGETVVRPYWQLEYVPEGQAFNRTDDDLVEELTERILDSVKMRMVGERPMGAFLSGGLDSSAVVAAMSLVSNQRIKTFSIGFDEHSHNELPHASRVAKRYGTDHHELVVRPDALEIIPRLAASFDEPFADPSAIPSWYLAEMASRQVVVALNGDGGDEAMGGYPRYLQYLTGGTRRIPRPIAESLLRIGTAVSSRKVAHPFISKAGKAALLMGESNPGRRYGRFVSYFRPEEKAAIISDEFASLLGRNDSHDLIGDLWCRFQGTDTINRLLAVDTHSYLPGALLPKVDITTMSVSLEARSPLLDHTLLEWAATIPGDRKIRNRSGKYLLKRALSAWLDEDLIHRRKQGFGVPLGDWIRGPLRSMTYDVLTDATASSRGIFEQRCVRALLDDHMSGIDRSYQVYALLMLELWYREVLEPAHVLS